SGALRTGYVRHLLSVTGSSLPLLGAMRTSSKVLYYKGPKLVLPLVGAMRTPAGEAGPVLLFQLLPLVGAMRTGGHRPFRGRRTVVTPRRSDEDTHSSRDLAAPLAWLPLARAMRTRP